MKTVLLISILLSSRWLMGQHWIFAHALAGPSKLATTGSSRPSFVGRSDPATAQDGVPNRLSPSGSSSSSTSLAMMGMDVAVAKASIAATTKLLSSIGLGGLAASKSDLLDASAISALSRLTYWIFQPAFLFCSVSKTIHSASSTATTGAGLPLRALWLMPLLATAQIALGTLSGRGLIKLFDIQEPDQVANVRMCTTFANSGPLPLIFTDALFGTNALLQSQVAAGISFYLLAWSPLFWTMGKILLAGDDDDDRKGESSSGSSTASTNIGATRVLTQIKTTLIRILSPPVIGSMTGLVVGMIGPLRQLFFENGIFQPLYGSLYTLGTAYLPAALLVLAGSLVGKKGKEVSSGSSSSSIEASTTTTKSSGRDIAAIVFSRFFVSPVLALGASLLVQQFCPWMDARTKAIVTFLCLMEGCMPPAQNSVILLQLAGRTQAASSMARLLTLLYAGAVIPVTILLTACLSRSGILAFL